VEGTDAYNTIPKAKVVVVDPTWLTGFKGMVLTRETDVIVPEAGES
jgi:hypothetical protein